MPTALAAHPWLLAIPAPQGLTSLVAWLFAPEAMGPAAPPAPELPSYGGLLLRTLIALLVVLVLAWVLLRWGLRRFLPGGGPTRALRVVARTPLDGRRAVVLVEAAGRYLLLGVGDASVSLLAELAPEEVDRALAEEQASRPRRFAEVLRERMARGRDPGTGEARDPSAGEGRHGDSAEGRPPGRDPSAGEGRHGDSAEGRAPGRDPGAAPRKNPSSAPQGKDDA